MLYYGQFFLLNLIHSQLKMHQVFNNIVSLKIYFDARINTLILYDVFFTKDDFRREWVIVKHYFVLYLKLYFTLRFGSVVSSWRMRWLKTMEETKASSTVEMEKIITTL